MSEVLIVSMAASEQAANQHAQTTELLTTLDSSTS